MNNTRFLYEAAANSAAIYTPKGEEVSVHPLIIGEEVGECAFRSCMRKTKRGHERQSVIKKTFTDHQYLTDSQVVCEYCVWAIGAAVKDASQGGVRWLRNYSLYATEDALCLMTYAQWREVLSAPPPAVPYLACVAVSGQKWLSFKASLGYSRLAWQVMFEERKLFFAPKAFGLLVEPMEGLYSAFSKDSIRSGDYRGDPVPLGGEEVMEHLEAKIARHRGSDLFELALRCAQKHEIEHGKGEACTTASRPKTKSAQSQLF
jgi:hypothetical protein